MDFAGQPRTPVFAAANPSVVAALSSYAAPYDETVYAVRLGGSRGARGKNGAGTLAPTRDVSGAERLLFGSELWDKLILTPSHVDVGTVLANFQFVVTLWNTHRRAASTLTALNVTGHGQAAVQNPAGLPLAFWPFQARSFVIIVPLEGETTIDDTITFVFDDGSISMHVTGQRAVVFPFEPDWSGAVTERLEYLTQVIASWNSRQEQRLQMRKHPRPVYAFRVFTTTPEDTTTMQALLLGWQSHLFAVPIWSDVQPLLADVPAEGLTVAVDTTLRNFTAPGVALLWRSPSNFEAVSVVAVAPDSLTLTSPTTDAWAADGQTLVVPLALGRLPMSQTVDKRSADTAEADLIFACEVV